MKDKMLLELLSEKEFKKILEEALSRGGDFAEIYLEHRIKTEIFLEEDKLKNVSYGVLFGAGVRVNSGEKTGYAFSDEISLEKVKRASQVASHIANSNKKLNPLPLKTEKVKPYFTLESPVSLMGDDEKINYLKRANQAARDYHRKIEQVKVEWYDEAKNIAIINSEGKKISDTQHLIRMAIFPLAIDGSKKFEGYATSGGKVNISYFDKYPPEKTGIEAARQAVEMLSAADTPAGSLPVVVGNGWGGVLIHEAFGHSLEGDGIRKRTSLMASQLNQKVASEVVTVIDDATIPYGRGSFNIDDEGTLGQNKVLVKNGILQGYLYDKLNAKLMKTNSTGNGRRESYRHYPIPRMTNTYIKKGETDPEDIIKSVKNGVYAKKLGGGSVDHTTGNFNFLIREAYLIEDGKVTQPVKGAVLIGNGLEAVKKIELVGNDLRIDPTTGTCGKDGQSVFAGVGQPTVKFTEMTVGGTKIKKV
ncbi:MAG: hypothetical protein AMJ90_01200 [candidate division Zixibacteria bacterium SM23_73_2]|nr:MAG: hypothetical protein AMJ90_01200 [candidate division Zixibacteria bacterium SM23_73_2]